MSVITVTVEWSLGVFHAHTSMVVLLGFIVPFIVNSFEFILRTIKEYREDLANRAKSAASKVAYQAELDTWRDKGSPGRLPYDTTKGYNPELTVGHILARLIGIFTPVINFLVMVANMDRVFEWIGNGFRALGKLFDIPLVPRR